MKKSAFHYLFVTVAGLTAALFPVNILAAPGDLFETDQGSSTIFKFTPVGAKSTFASGLGDPFGLAFDRLGDLYEVNYNSGTDYELYPAVAHNTFVWELNRPIAVEVNL